MIRKLSLVFSGEIRKNMELCRGFTSSPDFLAAIRYLTDFSFSSKDSPLNKAEKIEAKLLFSPDQTIELRVHY